MLIFGRSTVKQIASGDPFPVFHERFWLVLVKRDGVAWIIRVVLTSSSFSIQVLDYSDQVKWIRDKKYLLQQSKLAKLIQQPHALTAYKNTAPTDPTRWQFPYSKLGEQAT